MKFYSRTEYWKHNVWGQLMGARCENLSEEKLYSSHSNKLNKT